MSTTGEGHYKKLATIISAGQHVVKAGLGSCHIQFVLSILYVNHYSKIDIIK